MSQDLSPMWTALDSNKGAAYVRNTTVPVGVFRERAKDKDGKLLPVDHVANMFYGTDVVVNVDYQDYSLVKGKQHYKENASDSYIEDVRFNAGTYSHPHKPVTGEYNYDKNIINGANKWDLKPDTGNLYPIEDMEKNVKNENRNDHEMLSSTDSTPVNTKRPKK